jgi:hypothetical protein
MAVAYYFIDYTNGNDARTGLRIPAGDITSITYNTVDSTADTTHFVDAALTGADDYILGSYVWNVTRGIGALITDFVALTDTVTLGSAIAGMTAGDSYYILDSWKTINKYTTTTARTAGDIAYLRANMTHTQGAADIICDEVGTSALYISLIGCNATQVVDPWHDASDALPVIDFNNGAYQMNLARNFWFFKNLSIKNSNDANGIIYINYARVDFTNCVFNNATHTTFGIRHNYPADCLFIDCAFEGVGGSGATTVYNSYGTSRYVNCTFNATVATTYGFSQQSASAYFDGCSIGNTGNYASYDFQLYNNSFAYMRNCKFYSTLAKRILYEPAPSPSMGAMYCQDAQQVYGDNIIYTRQGTVTRVTTPLRPNGAASCAKMEPDATFCGIFDPLTLKNSPGQWEPDFCVWCTAGSHTITVYMLSITTWGGVYPTAAELFLEAEYVSNATDGTIARTTVVSTAVLADATTWVPFTVTVIPVVASFVNLKVKLGKYVAANGVYVENGFVLK